MALSEHAGEAGIRWFLALDDAIASLAEFPHRCPLAPETGRFPFEVRQLLYGRKPHVCRILFAVEDDTVTILHIRHGRRKPLSER
jgi:plasmid stabilization system protein ParE